MNRYNSLIKQSFLSILCFMLVFCCKPSDSAFAQIQLQRIDFPSSPNPVGSGARALGMGGAFIAIADDATAASWNPAGLAQLERPEISFGVDAFHLIEDNTYRTHPEAYENQSVSDWSINYFSTTYPFSFSGYNINISLIYQKLYSFKREWNFSIQDSNESFYEDADYGFNLDGNLSALGIACGVRITPRFSFGLTLNIWDDELTNNEWETKISQRSFGIFGDESFMSTSNSFDRYSFSGFNANFGILWNVNNQLTIGAVLKTPFEADLKHEHLFNASVKYPAFPISDSTTMNALNENATMDMPISYGIGFAYRFSNYFKASLDIYRTEWDDFILTDSNGFEMSPITGQSIIESRIDPIHQIRMGAEYLLINPKHIIPLRCGIFYDSAPAEGSPDDFFGFSIGSGITTMNRLSFDIAYQYRFGNNVGTSILKSWNHSQDVNEHTVYSSVIMYF
ncbi:MAG: hypothetical protein GY795_43695 [Desulfobacterales bacterium]|nr:hypothetical protein [Desulfobacterales bacterium]